MNQAALNDPTQNPTGQFVVNEHASAPQMVTRARTTDSPIATSARSLKDLAAAGGPIMSVKINSAPTTGTVMVVAQARITRKMSSSRCGFSPWAAAISGAIDDINKGR